MTNEEALKILKYRSGWNLSIRDVTALNMAIEALESCYNPDEWCHDCSEYNQDKHCCPRYTKVIRNAVEEMKKPKVGHWISVSERLPEESGRYLISVLDGVGRKTTVAPYQPRYKAWTMTGRMAYWKVIAWMPLPEPYEPQESEEKE